MLTVDMTVDMPKLLQWKAWMTIMLHFLNGNENIVDLQTRDLIIKTEDGKKTIHLRDFKQKTIKLHPWTHQQRQ